MRRLGLGCVAFALLVFVVGCGGGGGDESSESTQAATTTAALSKEELLAQGDAICAEVNAAVGTVGSTSSSEAGGEAAQVAGLYGGMVERLKALGAPSGESAGYPEFITAAEALAQAEANLELAAEREEGGETLSAAEAEASTALTSFQSAASSFGFEQCAETPAAPTPKPAAGGSSGEEASSGGVEEGAAEEAAPEAEAPAPEEAPPVEEESAGGGAGVGGGTGGGGEAGGGGSGGIGPG